MTAKTSTGHTLAAATWLDAHFRSARTDYEDALDYLGLNQGAKVLDAGCGGGGYLKKLSDLVGKAGSVTACDLAPENVEHVKALVADGTLPDTITAVTSSVSKLPFKNATLDAVWCANVAQYLSEEEFKLALAEFKRVTKPGGLIAIKEFDATLVQFIPYDIGLVPRFNVARGAIIARKGILGSVDSNRLMSIVRQSGLVNLRRKSWLVERWSPLGEATKQQLSSLLPFWSDMAADCDLPESDKKLWRTMATDPNSVFANPDFCWREGFVVAVGQVPNT